MLNHVEFTVPRGTLTADFCTDLDQLLCGILGWSEGRNLTLPNPTTGGTEFARWYDATDEQYVVLHEHDRHVSIGVDDHFGWRVESFDQLDEILEECKKLQARDERLEFLHVVDGRPSTMETETHRFGGFYAKYLMPVYLDINYNERIS
jgi:hypothetical protein